MTTDYHSHILPNIDDGSDSIKTSLKMIKMMKQQGIGIIVATPHFYMHREASLDSYLVKRQNAYEKLMSADPAVKDIHIGAEVAIEKGISVLGELEKLCISGTRLILLEPPFTQYNSWIVEEVPASTTVPGTSTMIYMIPSPNLRNLPRLRLISSIIYS